MNVYVATSFQEKELAKKVMDLLIKDGHTISYDWTTHDATGLSGEALEKYLAESAVADLKGVEEAEVLFLLCHPNGKGMYTELGYALAFNNSVDFTKKIVAVEHPEVHNVFLHHPSVLRVKYPEEGVVALRALDMWREEVA